MKIGRGRQEGSQSLAAERQYLFAATAKIPERGALGFAERESRMNSLNRCKAKATDWVAIYSEQVDKGLQCRTAEMPSECVIPEYPGVPHTTILSLLTPRAPILQSLRPSGTPPSRQDGGDSTPPRSRVPPCGPACPLQSRSVTSRSALPQQLGAIREERLPVACGPCAARRPPARPRAGWSTGQEKGRFGVLKGGGPTPRDRSSGRDRSPLP